MGIIEEVGSGVTLLKKGDRVVLPFNVADGRCLNCEEGNTAFCTGVNPGFAGGAFGYVAMGPYQGGQVRSTHPQPRTLFLRISPLTHLLHCLGAIPPGPLRRLQRPPPPSWHQTRIFLRPPRRHFPHWLARHLPLRLQAWRNHRRLWCRPCRPHGRLLRLSARSVSNLRRRSSSRAAGDGEEDSRVRACGFLKGGCSGCYHQRK